MQACLADGRAGYYTTRQPIGRDGDFVTAPEISQVFGELLGVWAAAVWQAMGEPTVVFAELGPGRGTLMADALRVFVRVPQLLESITIALVETSPVLREMQANTLRGSPALPQWCESIEDLPQGPLILIANEFIDALPVRQFVRAPNAWHERCVALSDKSGFIFCAGAPVEPEAVPQSLNAMTMAEGEIVETRPAISSLLADLATAGEGRTNRRTLCRLRPRRERCRRHAASGPEPSLRGPPRRAGRSRPHSACRFCRAERDGARAWALHLWADAAGRIPAQARARGTLRAASAKCYAYAEGGDHVRRGATCRSAADGGFVQDARAAIARACPAASLRRHLTFRLRTPWSHQTK